MSDKLKDKNIVDEMSNSFLDYAMSVIVSRALPDARDGLKPVHRRILYAMYDLGNTPDKPYKKSARIVGDVIGKYHPHGDSSVYEAMVRMSQEFSFLVPLVDGHGNFGSLDGDGAAAMRYTEARMSKMGLELLRDINKKTIDYQENYDSTEMEPIVLPARFPNLLVNGTTGIAVGMATSIPPHNLGEVIDATVAYIKNNEISIEEINEHIIGPDFPLGGEILGDIGIKKAYHTGNGSIKVRSKYDVVYAKNEKPSIIITEIPFQINKSNLMEKIADVVRNKKVEGVTDLRDESDRDGVRIVIELTRASTPDIVMNSLFKNTQLESTFSLNMLALVNGTPKILNIKELLKCYSDHQIEVIVRKTKFEKEKAEKRAHILEGLQICLNNIDDIIKIIKSSETQEIAQKELLEKYSLTDKQSKAVLEMQLRRLTGLERGKIDEELKSLLELIAELKSILESEEKINEIIIEDLHVIKEKHAKPRKTKIIEGYIDSSIDYEDLIEERNTIITLTNNGYIKRISPDEYRSQNRGGKGLRGMNLNDEDFVNKVLFASTHSDLLFFTDTGKVYKTRSHKIPEMSRTSKGIPLINIIGIESEEKITNIISIKDYDLEQNLVICTRRGTVKRTKLNEYGRINKNGKKAITLIEDDQVQSVLVVKNNDNLFFGTKEGKALATKVESFRAMGRTSKGVRGLRLSDIDEMIGMEIAHDDNYIFTIASKGFGKATSLEQYSLRNRGGKGMKNMNTSDATGNVITIKSLSMEDIQQKDALIMTKFGQIIRLSCEDVKISSRATKGVRIMRLKDGDEISTVELIEKTSKIEEDVSRETEEGSSEE